MKNTQHVAPCGRCAACVANRRSEWATRLEYELKDSKNADFISLTYSEENKPINDYGNGMLYKTDVQLFIKRLRKAEYPNKIRYYLCAEYGEQTFRPHYHMILFNCSKTKDQLHELLLKTWNLGLIHIGEVNPASIKYITGYMVQQKQSSTLSNEKIYERPFSLQSQGLGRSYIEKHKKWHKQDLTRLYVPKEGGNKVRLPRYYRDKIYSSTDKLKQKIMLEANLEFDLQKEKDSFHTEIDKKEQYKKKVLKSLKNNSKL